MLLPQNNRRLLYGPCPIEEREGETEGEPARGEDRGWSWRKVASTPLPLGVMAAVAATLYRPAPPTAILSSGP